MPRILLLFVLLAFVSSSPVSASEKAAVSFYPSGVVKTLRQAKAIFSRQLAPFGAISFQDPFTVKCGKPGKGRWLDGKTWVYDFESDLPGGVSCSFVSKEIKGVDGELAAGVEYAFSTGGPFVEKIFPFGGRSERVEEEQVFILTLTAEPEIESAKSNLACEIDGIAERVGVNIIEGKKRDEIIKEYGKRWEFHMDADNSKDKPNYLVFQCKQRFPNEKDLAIVWGKGIKSKSGIGTVEAQTFKFKTRPKFSARFSCERENPKSPCIPVRPMSLNFSTGISVKAAGQIKMTAESGKEFKPDLSAAEKDKRETVQYLSFKGPFPENTQFSISLPADLNDEDGRQLSNAAKFPLKVGTGNYPLLAKFAAKFGIIELADPVLPITVRNIEKEIQAREFATGQPAAKDQALPASAKLAKTDAEIISWLKLLDSAKRTRPLLNAKSGEVRKMYIPKPGAAKDMEVVGIPLKGAGLHIVEVESRLLGDALLKLATPMYVHSGALVTNMAATFKWGRESSLVWVTSLNKAEPVPGASVAIRDCAGSLIWEGLTGINGVAMIPTQLPSPEKLTSCRDSADYSDYIDTDRSEALSSINYGLFVFARKGDDVTFTHSNWKRGIEPWRFNLPDGTYQSPYSAATVLDRTLFHPGETVHMKHYFRLKSGLGFSKANSKRLPRIAEISFASSDQKYKLPIKWDAATGSAQMDWKIPESANLGQYTISLTGAESGKSWSPEDRDIVSGEFKVGEFRVPLMRGVIQSGAKPVINQKKVTVDLSVDYLAGGPASMLPVKLRSILSTTYPSFPDYEGYSFESGILKEGVYPSSEEEELDEAGDEAAQTKDKSERQLKTAEITLGKSGSAREVIDLRKKVDKPSSLLVEMEYKDPNGELQTVSQRIKVWPTDIALGVKPYSWSASKDSVKFHIVALDTSGKPVAGASVSASFYKRQYYTHRKKLIGGFYAYDSMTEIRKLGKACEGKTDSRGLLLCESKTTESGDITIAASAAGQSGGTATANAQVWVAGKEDWWFEADDNDRIDLIPEKKRYEPGETAVFQARSPFRVASALVTVEREGILSASVVKVSGKEPVIKIPVKENYGPNVFVSALLARGRAGEFQPTAMVDLGKPAFKLGVAEILVGWSNYELKVDVKTDKEVYRPRGEVRADITAKRADGSPASGGFATVAIVDEGLLELQPNRTWKLLDAMMARRGYSVDTSVPLTQIVGKRHFGLKAVPAGGSGGRQMSRELFDTLVYWKATVPLDVNGKAAITAKLNDSITSFRVVAVVAEGLDKFGMGESSIRSSQELSIFAGLPPKVREEDTFTAPFTVRNTASSAMDVKVAANVKFDDANADTPAQNVKLSPGESKTVEWKVAVPAGAKKAVWKVEAQGSSGAFDSVTKTQTVSALVRPSVYQSTLVYLDKTLAMMVGKPEMALPGKGGVRVTLMPSIGTLSPATKEYMEWYPFTCMEQRVSRAVVLADAAMWKKIISDLPSYLDSRGFVKYFPMMRDGSEVLTAYVLSISSAAGLAIPDETKSRMASALNSYIYGQVAPPAPLNAADDTIRKLMAMEALARIGKGDPRWADSLTISPGFWPSSALTAWIGYLQNVKRTPALENHLAAAIAALKSRIYMTGSTMALNDENQSFMWWLITTDGDSTAAKALLGSMDNAEWSKESASIARGLTMRAKSGRWQNTSSNAWAVTAMRKYGRIFESEPVTGGTIAKLGAGKKAVDWKKSPKGGALMFPWPDNKSALDVRHEGKGTPYAVVDNLAAIPVRASIANGVSVKKTISAVERKTSGKWSVGDIVKVDVEITTKADMSWITINDPIPAGATALGGGLGRDSAILASKAKPESYWRYPAFVERSFDSIKAYYEYAPKGTWTYSYNMRLNNQGAFKLPATTAEALYVPEMMGATPNEVFAVEK